MRYLSLTLILFLGSLAAACATEQPAVVQPAPGAVVEQATAAAPAGAPTEVLPADMPDDQPIMLTGTGQAVTDPVTIPWDTARANFTHNGSRNFVVKAYQGDEETLLVNAVGNYEGSHPLFGAGEVYFDIDADGAWTGTIEDLGQADGAPFSGTGYGVSGFFDAPASGPWTISHDGTTNFVVVLHCGGIRNLIENEIGKVSGSTVVDFGENPCFWEIQADGDWSLAPE